MCVGVGVMMMMMMMMMINGSVSRVCWSRSATDVDYRNSKLCVQVGSGQQECIFHKDRRQESCNWRQDSFWNNQEAQVKITLGWIVGCRMRIQQYWAVAGQRHLSFGVFCFRGTWGSLITSNSELMSSALFSII
jgi:hypothetical protein